MHTFREIKSIIAIKIIIDHSQETNQWSCGWDNPFPIVDKVIF